MEERGWKEEVEMVIQKLWEMMAKKEVSVCVCERMISAVFLHVHRWRGEMTLWRHTHTCTLTRITL